MNSATVTVTHYLLFWRRQNRTNALARQKKVKTYYETSFTTFTKLILLLLLVEVVVVVVVYLKIYQITDNFL